MGKTYHNNIISLNTIEYFYSYAETVNLIDPALAEGLSIEEGGWSYRPPIESQYFAGIATDEIKVKFKTRKGSDVSVRERVKPEIQMQTDILNYFVNLIEEFSKGWYKSRESIDTCSELYRFLSNKYSDRDYNEEYFISQLKELGVSADDLEYINRYDVVDGHVAYGGPEHQNLKGFFNTFLQLIQRKLDPNNYDYYDPKWANDPIFSALTGDDKHFTFLDKPNKFTEKEAKLANSINAALMKIFGFTGLFMLRTGLLTFSIDSDENYKYNNLIPKIKDLVRIFRNQKITGLNIMDAEIGGKNFPHGSYGADMFNSPDNRIQKLISCLLSGYRVSLELIDDQGKNLGKFFFVKNKPTFQYHEKRFVNFDPYEANRDDIDAMVSAFVKGLYGKITKVELFYDSCEIIIENLYKKVDWKIDHNVLEMIPGLTLEETEQKLKYTIRSGIWTLRCGPKSPRARIESLIKDHVAGQVEINIRYNEPGTGYPKVKLFTFQLYLDIDIDIYDNPRVHRFGRISDSILKEEWEEYLNMREGNV